MRHRMVNRLVVYLVNFWQFEVALIFLVLHNRLTDALLLGRMESMNLFLLFLCFHHDEMVIFTALFLLLLLFRKLIIF